MASNQYPSLLQGIAGAQCPKCRHERMFSHKAYDLRNFLRMPERCPHCGFRFEVEPGFWWGSMYITYAFNVAILVAGLICYFMFALPVWTVVLGIFFMALILLPVLVRLSRVLLLYLFGQVAFDPRRHDNTPAQNAPYFEEHPNPS
ncbi:MAG: DUF983 domain-containing protein [Bacteroidetes bacterium]|nr:DUF983 domain-containing protein [Bacteroidota bacterium]